MGARLFERTTRRVSLTPAGRRLLPQANRTLVEAARCHSAVSDGATNPPFELSIGTRYELGMSWLVPMLSELAEQRPERSLALYFGDSPDLLRRIEHGQLDGMVSSVRLVSPNLDYARLHEERYVFVASKALLAKQPLDGNEDAIDHALLDIHRDLPLFRYFLDARPADETWHFKAHEHLGTIAAVRHRLLECAGVAVLPRYFVRDDLAAGDLIALFGDTEPRLDAFRLVWRRENPLADELRALAQTLQQHPLQ